MTDAAATRISKIIADFASMSARDLAMVYQDILSKALAADAPAIFDHYSNLAKAADAIGSARFREKDWAKAREEAEIPF